MLQIPNACLEEMSIWSDRHCQITFELLQVSIPGAYWMNLRRPRMGLHFVASDFLKAKGKGFGVHHHDGVP